MGQTKSVLDFVQLPLSGEDCARAPGLAKLNQYQRKEAAVSDYLLARRFALNLKCQLEVEPQAQLNDARVAAEHMPTLKSVWPKC